MTLVVTVRMGAGDSVEASKAAMGGNRTTSKHGKAVPPRLEQATRAR